MVERAEIPVVDFRRTAGDEMTPFGFGTPPELSQRPVVPSTLNEPVRSWRYPPNAGTADVGQPTPAPEYRTGPDWGHLRVPDTKPSNSVEIPSVHPNREPDEFDVTAYAADSPEARVYDKADDAIARIEVIRSDGEYSGTGFFISEDGKLATVYHVIRDAESIHVVTADGRTYRAKIEDVKPTSDMATLRVEALPGERFSALEIAETSRSLKKGDPLYAIGHANGWHKQYLSPGFFLNRSIVADEGVEPLFGQNPNRILMEGFGQGVDGQSGSPVLDSQGRVVGILSFGAPNRIFAGTAEDLRSMLGRGRNEEYLPQGAIFGRTAYINGTFSLAGLANAYALRRPDYAKSLSVSTGLVGAGAVLLGVSDFVRHDYSNFMTSWAHGTPAEKFNASTNVTADLMLTAGGIGTLFLGPRYRFASSLLIGTGSAAKFLNQWLGDRMY